MRTLGFVMVVSLVAACRFGFQEQPDGGPADAAPPPPPDAPAVLACGAPERFPMIAAPTQVAATATANGYNVIISNGTELRGYAYSFAGDDLVLQRDDVLLFSAGLIGEFTTIADGDRTLLAVTSGPAAILPGVVFDTTTVISLDAQLRILGKPVAYPSWVAGVGSLARSRAGAFGFIGTPVPSSEIAARVIASDGTALGLSNLVTPDGRSPTIVPAGDDFLVVWHAFSETCDKVRVALHAMTPNSFETKVPEQILSDPANNAFNARAAYSAASQTFLVSWVEKPAGDHIWISVLDSSLKKVVTKDLGPGNVPVVIAGERDFLVVWRIDRIRLGAVRVTPTGDVEPVLIEGTAREALGMDLVVRAGQPALVWAETGDNGGATMRIDPLCAR